MDFPGGSVVKNPPADAGDDVGDAGSVPRLGRSPGEGNATRSSIPAWTEEPGGFIFHEVVKSQTRLSMQGILKLCCWFLGLLAPVASNKRVFQENHRSSLIGPCTENLKLFGCYFCSHRTHTCPLTSYSGHRSQERDPLITKVRSSHFSVPDHSVASYFIQSESQDCDNDQQGPPSSSWWPHPLPRMQPASHTGPPAFLVPKYPRPALCPKAEALASPSAWNSAWSSSPVPASLYSNNRPVLKALFRITHC